MGYRSCERSGRGTIKEQAKNKRERQGTSGRDKGRVEGRVEGRAVGQAEGMLRDKRRATSKVMTKGEREKRL